MDVLQLPQGGLRLVRPGAAEGLRAWDAADEQLIEHARNLAFEGCRLAVIDDSFGALSLALADFRPQPCADSAMLNSGLEINGPLNGLPVMKAQSWLSPPEGPFDLILLRIPRQADYLSWLLRWANSALAPGGRILAGGMIKHIPDRSAAVFGELVGTESVFPARKKARVIQCKGGEETLAGWSGQWLGYHLPDSGLRLEGLPAVFARDRLDIGARLLLPQVARLASEQTEGARLLDLACGNGVLGLSALHAHPGLDVAFSDVSSQAVVSVRHNAALNFPGREVSVDHCDGVPAGDSGFDLILLNPPFHEAGVVGDHIAMRLFQQASQSLRPGGRVLVVGNRHLGYHRTLRRWFGQVAQLDADPRFVVFEAGAQGAGRS
ncbi:methyltransferase [Marinobacter sp.]|uniref:methyltransferase n=1 Tax=Marinobacter sp. TaxID=50741 RepID=UPI00384CC724